MRKEEYYMTFLTESIKKDEKIGLAGVGTMGKCILEGLKKNGFQVVVYDPFIGAQEYAQEHGAIVVKELKELALQANIILMSLPKPQNILEVVGGEEGLKDHLTEKHILIDTSTVDPTTSKEAAKIAEKKRAHYIDAPILGRPSAVGNWLMPSGGDPQYIEYVSPVLKCFAKKVVHVGEHGAGNAFKLLNQLMFSVINGVSAEVMALTEVLGIDKKKFYDVVSNSGAATVSGLFCETAGRIAEERYDNPTFTMELLCKDAGLGIEMVHEAGVTPLIAGFVQTLNENAKGKGLAKKDTSALAEVFEQFYSKIQ